MPSIQAMLMFFLGSESSYEPSLTDSSPPSRTIASYVSQISWSLPMPLYMECEQGGLPRIKMNVKEVQRWQTCQ